MEGDKSPVIVIYLVGIIAILLALLFFAPFFFGDTVRIGSGGPAPDIVAYHQYKDGMHVYKGMIDLPTPCDALGTSVRMDGAKTAILSFETEQTAELCAQVITPQTFLAGFIASQNIDVTALFNGRKAKLITTEVPAGQDFEDIE